MASGGRLDAAALSVQWRAAGAAPGRRARRRAGGLRHGRPLGQPRRTTLLAGTASKLLWGGLRVGRLRGHPSLVARLTEAKKAIDLGVAVIDQLLAADLLCRTAQARELRRAALVDRLGRTEELLRSRRAGWMWSTPAGGTGLWVDTGEDVIAMTERARRRGLLLAAGPAFSAFNGFERHIRLPFWHPAERIEEALERLDG